MTFIDTIDKIRELLHEGLTNNEWSCVSEAYFLITGERVQIQEADETMSVLKELMTRIDKLQSDKNETPVKKPRKRGRPRKKKVEDNDDTIEEFAVRKTKPKDDKIVKASNVNKFESMDGVLEEAEQEKGFNQIDDSKVVKSERARRKYTPAKVTCNQCNKSYEVNPLFAKGNYTCDKCIYRRIG